MSILIVVGTRPEIIKMAPVIKELEKRSIEFVFVHTGQHYDYEMSRVFVEELGLPSPHVSFELSSSTPASQIGEMIIKLDNQLVNAKKRLRIMLVHGDTNTTLAAAIAGIKMGLRVGHVEAGLRSFDWRMPEEHNRRMVDHISHYLFAPTNVARRNLEEEGVWGEVFVTGNTVIDAIEIYFNKVLEIESKVMEKVKFDEYVLVTFHRSENVDNPVTLRDFVRILEKTPIPVVFPIHPRTRKRLTEYGLWSRLESLGHVQVMPPVGYFEFLALLKNCRLVMTDSGGVQEESTHPRIKKPVLVLRTSTERPEAVVAGFARVVGTNPVVVLAELEKMLTTQLGLPDSSPFGDGKAAQRIVEAIIQRLE